MSNISNNINYYFEHLSYSEAYSFDIWITIIIILFIAIIAIYFFIINTLRSYKSSWNSMKCNPLIMPFASIINSEDASFDYNYTQNNFNSCMNDLNKSLTDKVDLTFKKSFTYFSGLLSSASQIAVSINQFIVYLYTELLSIFNSFSGRMLSVVNENNKIFLAINNFISLVMGFVARIYYKVTIIVDSIKLMLPIFAMAILIGVIIPAIIATITTLILSIVLYVMSSIILFFPFFVTIPLFHAFIFPAMGAFVSFLFLLAFTILVTILYSVFSNFATNVLKRTLAPITRLPNTVLPNVPPEQ
jgi:hypothetical protein